MSEPDGVILPRKKGETTKDMGADNLATFDRWQRWREIFTMPAS